MAQNDRHQYVFREFEGGCQKPISNSPGGLSIGRGSRSSPRGSGTRSARERIPKLALFCLPIFWSTNCSPFSGQLLSYRPGPLDSFWRLALLRFFRETSSSEKSHSPQSLSKKSSQSACPNRHLFFGFGNLLINLFGEIKN